MSKVSDRIEKTAGETFRKLNPDLERQLRGVLETMPKGWCTVVPTAQGPVVLKQAEPKERRIRQSQKPLLNKLEGRFFSSYLMHLGVRIHAQSKRYMLANGLWYKPDFTAVIAGEETAWEVKGPKAWRGGFENLKVAASTWPEVRWILVWEIEHEWRFQVVVPGGCPVSHQDGL